jgi:signal transduction histidine kinase
MRRLRRERGLRSQAEAFSAGFEPALLDPRVWVPVRLGTGVGLFALAWAASSVDPLRQFFQLRPAWPLGLLLASVVLVFALGTLNLRDARKPTLFLLGVLAYSFLEVMASASFAVFSEAPGAFLLATIPVLRGGLNGLGLGARAGLPAFAVTHGLGVLAAAALRPDAPHAWLVLLAAPATMGSFLYLAQESGRLAQGRALVAAQGAALQAQLMVERASSLQLTRASLGDVLQRRHDARSALSTARLAADRLAPILRGDAREPLLRELVGALEALQQVVAGQRAPRRAAPSAGPGLERVEVEPVVHAVLASVRQGSPGLRTSVGVEPAGVRVRVRGGAPALYQILEQLARNAAEGDGTRRARQIEVAVVGDAAAGGVAIRVADDGPGFRAGLLEQLVAPFATTKPYGVGLGLYTAERLASASGGSLRLENRPGGGAAVTVYLEQAVDAARRSA